MARTTLRNVAKLLNSINESVSVEQMFLSDLKATIERGAAADDSVPSQTYKPSSMKCLRNMFFQITGAERDIFSNSYCSVGICNSGSDIHVRTQQAVERMKEFGMDCDYIDVSDYVQGRELEYIEIKEKSGMETKLYHTELNMSFMCDGLIRYKGRYYILEIKTETSFKWSKRDGVDESHYMQGVAYSLALQVPDVLFLYINRDILDMKAYLFTPTDEMKQALLDKISECQMYVDRQECPPIPEDISKKTCSYCAYKTACERNN